MKENVLLSYAAADRESAATVRAGLRARGIHCRLHEYAVGPDAPKVLQQLPIADIIVFIVSKQNAHVVQLAHQLTLADRRDVIARIAEVEPLEALEGLPWIGQWFDLFGDRDKGLDRLAAYIEQACRAPA